MNEVTVQKMVLDVLKPMEPSILELSRNINELDGVENVTIDLLEIDKKVENVKISIRGPKLVYDEVNSVIESTGATIHSIDNVYSTRETPISEE